jgi:hypothetical protein
VIVTPDTVLRWQRHRFRKYWTQLSGRPTGGRPPINAEIRTLITRMATANPLCGAPRIHGEILKLGIDVAERTVSRLMTKRRPEPSQTWRALHVLDRRGLQIAHQRQIAVTLGHRLLVYPDAPGQVPYLPRLATRDRAVQQLAPIVVEAHEVRRKAHRPAQKSDRRDAFEVCDGIRRGLYRSVVRIPSLAISTLRTALSRRHLVRTQTSEVNAAKRLLRGAGWWAGTRTSLRSAISWDRLLLVLAPVPELEGTSACTKTHGITAVRSGPRSAGGVGARQGSSSAPRPPHR